MAIFLPIQSTLVVILALDHWNAPQWLWGVIGAIFGLFWIVSIIEFFRESRYEFDMDEMEKQKLIKPKE